MQSRVVSTILSVIGGVVGGVIGYIAFSWLVAQNLYGLMIPGACVGLGCGLLSRNQSVVRGVVCALAAVALALYTEWKFFPFIADRSLGYLLRHVFELKPLTLVMIVVGGLIAYWMGKDAMLPVSAKETRPTAEPRSRDEVG
jgi:hypothetical protein